MSNASSQLQWQLIRKHHAALVQRDGYALSKEAGNLTNRHSYKFNGLVNQKTVDVNVKAGKITLTTKKARSLSTNERAKVYSVPLLRHKVNGKIRAVEIIRAATKGNFHRADLLKYAVHRYHALHKGANLPVRDYVNLTPKAKRSINKSKSKKAKAKFQAKLQQRLKAKKAASN